MWRVAMRMRCIWRLTACKLLVDVLFSFVTWCYLFCFFVSDNEFNQLSTSNEKKKEKKKKKKEKEKKKKEINNNLANPDLR